MMRIQNWVILIFLFAGTTISAQINNQLLENPINVKDSLQQKVLLSIQSNNFFKNNEYFGKISTGYTLMGSQLGAQFAYMPNAFVRLQAGAFFQKDFGNDTSLLVKPILSCKIQKNGYSVIFGSLEGNISHRLIEPLYNYERFISNPIENGLQIKVDKEKLWSDTWLQWERMQYPGSTFQEEFSVGHHTDFSIIKQKQWELSIPLQFLVSHKGGQIDIDTTPLKTIANAAIGFKVHFNNQREGAFIKSLSTENYYTLFNDLSPTKTLTFKQGSGLYINATAISKYDIAASVGYWNASQFLASRGGYLFQSEASIYGTPGYVQANRNLLFFRVLYARKVFNVLDVNVRFEPYYDLDAATFEYSYSVFFTYKSDFTLFNVNKRK
ncbi:MAG: hypothetical protein IPK62_16730 [Bacteroidetes bacterium]|nr:hypothetical protein [Bacteroidota bacterium]MBK8146502.1 hypothetical protein [Bacteroidota bacterium]MBP6314082.1 hypothetical protein [Chitinophagaceae bacterium]